MGWRAWLKCAMGAALALSVVIEVTAKQPIFVSWLVADDPGDQTILHYWERFEQEELSPTEMVDLGTMLFYRGYPQDAVRVLEAALDQDKELYEAWFRIGLVDHQQGNLRDARIAYKRCLKILNGHAWCNFYLGLLEEQEGNAKKAMAYYQTAFRYAPELADREVNPEIASSDLSLGAWLMMAHDTAFKSALPMPFLHPKRVERIRASFDDAEPAESRAEKKARRQAKRQAEKAGTPESAKDPASVDSGQAILVPGTGSTDSSDSSESKSSKSSPAATPKSLGAGEPVKSPTPTPVPSLSAQDEAPPFGLPGNRGASSDGYPGL